jgi:hypothetical protein
MKKKQMMMALVSLMVLSAQAQVNFQVSVSNPSKVARTDAPVVVDLSKLGAIGNIQRAVVTVDGKEIPSQLDDTNRDCTNDELCFLADLGKKETKTYQVHLYRTLIDSSKDESFDDDYVIRGTLRYMFCGLESILELPEDSYYGSDFEYMMELICCCLLEECNGGLSEIEECSCNYSPQSTSDMTDEQLHCVDVWDDGVTWAEGHLRRPELEHVVVCHAVHDICTHKPYSIPDLLRLNDFW